MLSYQPHGRCTRRCVLASLRPVSASERDQVLDLAALRAMRDEHRVGGLDDGDVVEADHADQAAGRVDERVARVAQERVALHRVAVAVARADLPDGIPGAEVAPAGVERHHADRDARAVAARRLHDGVVDAVAGIAANASVRSEGRRRRCVAARERGLARRRDVGAKAAQRVEPDARAQRRRCRRSSSSCRRRGSLRGREVGLLDEGGDRPRPHRRPGRPRRRGCSRSRCRAAPAGCRGRRCRPSAAVRTARRGSRRVKCGAAGDRRDRPA